MTTNAPTHCTECDIYLSRYESATFDLAKAFNALSIAEKMHDQHATLTLRREYQDVLSKQSRAQTIFSEHQRCHNASLVGVRT